MILVPSVVFGNLVTFASFPKLANRDTHHLHSLASGNTGRMGTAFGSTVAIHLVDKPGHNLMAVMALCCYRNRSCIAVYLWSNCHEIVRLLPPLADSSLCCCTLNTARENSPAKRMTNEKRFEQ